MTPDLRAAIARARAALSERRDGVTIGKLPPGGAAPETTEPEKTLYEFLAEVNGGRYGGIDLWSVKEIVANEPVADALPGGRSAWLPIGQVLYEPLVLSRADGQVFLAREAGDTEFHQMIPLGPVDSFLADFVFGRRYAELIPDSEADRWYNLCRAIEAQ